MFMSPRVTIVHDEYHAFWALSHFDRGNTTYTFPFNKWTFSLRTSRTNKHKLTHTFLLSLWLNCSNFDQQLRVQSRYKHCRNLHYHHKESSIPSDVNNLKSLITFHVLSRTYPCRNSKFSWQRQLSLCLVHSAQFHSQIISFSFYTLFLYLLSNCAHVGRGQLCSICEVSVLVVGSGHHDIPFHISPIDIIVDLCHFEPPNIQYLHDPKMVMRPIIRIVRGNGFNLMPLIPNAMMMGIAGRSVVWDRNNISLQWTSDMCSVYSSWGLVNSGWRVRVVRRCVTFVSFFWQWILTFLIITVDFCWKIPVLESFVKMRYY